MSETILKGEKKKNWKEGQKKRKAVAFFVSLIGWI